MKLKQRDKAFLLLADGSYYEGTSIGSKGTSGGEICFNTGMTGYQEVYTDPSYFGQIIVNTNTHIGNYGAVDLEQESERPKINGLVVNEYSEIHSRVDGESTLDEYLTKSGVVGISGLDTRKIVKHIRSTGAMNAIITSEIDDLDTLKAELLKVPSMDHLELSTKVTTKDSYLMNEGGEYKVAVLDIGCKRSILSNLTDRGCELKVFPAETSFSELKAYNPDGYFISNGPGDPSAMPYAVETVKQIMSENKPMFGICLGHQVIALANGIGTFKMHHGHRGLNHPVKNIITGRSEVTSQNHGFAVIKEDVEASETIELTHINLNDNTVAGIRVKGKPFFSVQHHPEASPGPHDSRYLFDDFIQLIKKHRES
ncbi:MULTISPECIES: glutamine-hydrolyzing carbamoyl-phosphate synthase small subunit [Reichenbachiella]|uniref:glutamine-hydrolyzing carbamoyl-phosphate synthase small subunit n=1 Tax=Reichenbachiella TaxID=156993 RepID=UPI000E6D1B8A|nr:MULTISPECIES: glutamine-hydrolyzing carbamoyl-phosphate synthase small subunit [Reichenbachiella]MBU2915076.1 glutamine-hydrolyzing carbamoyl-phosphate synthase small subunit [Reichenbachiella agariperforans]RJE70502.1 carbamoyl phosphate synthase small subunit [Reichenbachiella sp. MSK19-1]